MEEKISEAIKNAVEGAPERKFVESLDIAFTIKDVDLKNPANRILGLSVRVVIPQAFIESFNKILQAMGSWLVTSILFVNQI